MIRKLAWVLNWLFLAFNVFAIGGLARIHVLSGSQALTVVPFAATLLALHFGEKRWFVALALLCNLALGLLGCTLMIFASQAAEPFLVGIIGLVLALVVAVNLTALIEVWRSLTASLSEEPQGTKK